MGTLTREVTVDSQHYQIQMNYQLPNFYQSGSFLNKYGMKKLLNLVTLTTNSYQNQRRMTSAKLTDLKVKRRFSKPFIKGIPNLLHCSEFHPE